MIEVLPFLDLKVIRYLDPTTNTLSNKLSIYRKDCHSGTYIHSLSDQPTHMKRSVIRSMFLRAYRYSDELFLCQEEKKIYEDFSNLGYNKRFINKAKVAAKIGRTHELRVRQGLEEPKPPRVIEDFNIPLPFHKSIYGVKHRLGSQGVDVTMTSKVSIRSRLAYKKPKKPTDAGVYMLTCKKADCKKVYIGQSKNIPKRLEDHQGAKTQPSKMYYASARHKGNGHDLDTQEGLVVYRSNSLPERLAIENCLIHECNTVKGNKTSVSNRDIDTLAPHILKGAHLDWKAIGKAQS